MQKKTHKGHKQFMIMAMIISLSYFLGAPFKNLQEGIIGFLLPVLLILSYFVFIKNSLFDKKNLLLVMITASYIVLSWIFVGGGIGSVLLNLTCIMYIFIFYEISFSEYEIRFCTNVIGYFNLIFCLLVFLMGYANGYVGVYNANTIAVQALLNILILDSYSENKKCFLIIQNFLSIVTVVYCRSRTSLVTIFIFYLFLIWMRKKTFRLIWIKLCYWWIVALGILIPIGNVMLYANYDKVANSKIMEYSIQYFNKSIFTGREYIWKLALDRLTENNRSLLFGIGSHFESELLLDSNFHNSFLTILICTGAVGYVLISILLYRLIKKRLKENNKIAIKCCFAYFSFMIIGLFESILFSGHFAILGFMMLSFEIDTKRVTRGKDSVKGSRGQPINGTLE